MRRRCRWQWRSPSRPRRVAGSDGWLWTVVDSWPTEPPLWWSTGIRAVSHWWTPAGTCGPRSPEAGRSNRRRTRSAVGSARRPVPSSFPSRIGRRCGSRCRPVIWWTTRRPFCRLSSGWSPAGRLDWRWRPPLMFPRALTLTGPWWTFCWPNRRPPWSSSWPVGDSARRRPNGCSRVGPVRAPADFVPLPPCGI